MTKLPADAKAELVARALAAAHDEEQDRSGKRGYALNSYNAGASVDYWNALATAALEQSDAEQGEGA
jgi:hypothetical protein